MAWAGVLRPAELSGYALLAMALVLGLICVTLLLRTHLPGWLIGATLPPVLILCSSGATLAHSLLGFEDAEAIQPINGYILVFGGGWALVALSVCALITLGRTFAAPLR